MDQNLIQEWLKNPRKRQPPCLKYAQLEGANLQGVSLRGVCLANANLLQANLQGADLRNADLRGAYLLEANLCEARLDKANFEGAVLFEASMEKSSAKKANFHKADLRKLSARNIRFTKAKFCHAKIDDAMFMDCCLKKIKATNVDFSASQKNNSFSVKKMQNKIFHNIACSMIIIILIAMIFHYNVPNESFSLIKAEEQQLLTQYKNELTLEDQIKAKILLYFNKTKNQPLYAEIKKDTKLSLLLNDWIKCKQRMNKLTKQSKLIRKSRIKIESLENNSFNFDFTPNLLEQEYFDLRSFFHKSVSVK